MIRVLMCGDRYWHDGRVIERELDCLIERYGEVVVIEGEARGADSMARDAALARGLEVERYPAEWEVYGKRAGPIRNLEMLEEGRPELVVAFHENIESSKGTINMVRQARRLGVPVKLVDS